jgi:hypothetical protein
MSRMNILQPFRSVSIFKIILSLSFSFFLPEGITKGQDSKLGPQQTIKIKESQKKQTDHSIFDSLLKKYVANNGDVDYAGLKKDEKKLDQYLNTLQKGLSDQTSEKEKLAFWINAYNAFTLKLILNHYPVSSILNLYEGKPWEYRWINIRGKTLSLDDIEHGIIRKEFKEPRIHFAVNCASRSCPPLQREAFTAKNLNILLEKATTAFVNGNQNRIAPDNPELSSIFKWYDSDFGDLTAFINKYSKVKVKRSAKITFLTYDWSLNEK